MNTRDLQSEDSLAAPFQQRRRFRGALIWGVTLVLLLAAVTVRTQEPQPEPEYKIKAAFLFNFAKFVEWPPEAFAGPKSPIVIGILGNNAIAGELERTVRNKTINDRPLAINEIRLLAQATNCHVLFINLSDQKLIEETLKGVRAAAVLTVGQSEQFIEAGGMIRFVWNEDKTKIRFQINNEAAKLARLKISSKLLSLAVSPTQ